MISPVCETDSFVRDINGCMGSGDPVSPNGIFEDVGVMPEAGL